MGLGYVKIKDDLKEKIAEHIYLPLSLKKREHQINGIFTHRIREKCSYLPLPLKKKENGRLGGGDIVVLLPQVDCGVGYLELLADTIGLNLASSHPKGFLNDLLILNDD